MASIEKRVRNGRAYYRARYRDPGPHAHDLPSQVERDYLADRGRK